LAIGAIEEQTGFREGVDVGRFDFFHAITTEFGAQIIDGDEKDVQLRLRENGCGESAEREE
jgi:hypothetical protein